MKNASLKEVTIKLPKGLANIISAKEIVGMVMDKLSGPLCQDNKDSSLRW
jgi:hypothetical protein